MNTTTKSTAQVLADKWLDLQNKMLETNAPLGHLSRDRCEAAMRVIVELASDFGVYDEVSSLVAPKL
jgi:hypothetical protein